jgi:hypothetical protein
MTGRWIRTELGRKKSEIKKQKIKTEVIEKERQKGRNKEINQNERTRWEKELIKEIRKKKTEKDKWKKSDKTT